MSVFLFTFLFSFAVWQLVSLFRPDWIRPVEQQGFLQWIMGRRVPTPATTAQLFIYVVVLSIVCVVCFWFLSYAIFHLFHAPLGLSLRITDAILGRHAAALVTGTIAGCLAGISFNRVLYQRANYELTGRDKVIFAALGMFVVLGIGGEDLIHSFASKLNKVSIWGAEVSFFDASNKLGQIANPNNASANGTPYEGTEPLGLQGSEVAFSLLTNLPQIVSIDADYIRFISAQSHTQLSVDDLNVAKIMALLIPAPISKCMAYIYSRNLDKAEIDDIFNDLLKTTRGITHPREKSNNSLTHFFKEYVNQAKKFLDEHQELIKPRDPSDENYLDDKEDEKLKCAALVEEICSNSGIITKINKLNNIIFTRDSEQEYLLNKMMASLNSCNSDPITVDLGFFLHRIDQKRVLRRPYASIVRASMFAQVDHYEAALKELYTWLKLQERKKAEYNEAQYKWFRLRAQTTMSLFLEEWIRKLGNKTPRPVHHYHIKLLDETATELRYTFDLDEFKPKEIQLKRSIEENEFNYIPHDDNECKLNDREKIQARIFTAVIASKLQSAYHKLLDSSYVQVFSHEVATAIDELMRTDFSCMHVLLSKEEVTRMRAELFAAYARMKAEDAQAVSDVRGQSSMKADLESAIAALDLGQQMLDGLMDCSIPPRKPNRFDNFNDLISGNPLEEACAELKLQRINIKSMLNQISQ